jgi:nucleotide-binding universal stress UspA family protein
MMERILVSMDVRQSHLEGVHRAVHLAKRIEASVSILLVSDSTIDSGPRNIFQDLEESVRRRLELMIQMGRSEGLDMNTYTTQGNYLEEVIRFIQENGITLLVLGSPRVGSRAADEFTEAFDAMRHRISCRVELVTERSTSLGNQASDEGEGTERSFGIYDS